MRNFRNYVHFFMMVLLISTSLVFIACPVDSPASENKTVKDDDKEKENPSPITPVSGGGPDTGIEGARNSSFRYFYYPTDKKIYYVSGNDIYTMALDGASPIKIKDNAFTGDAKARYIYVYKDKVYYDNGTSIYRMNLDSTSHEKFIEDGHGMMKVYNDRLYYFVTNKTNARVKDLMSIPLDKGDAPTKVLDDANCYIDERRKGGFYVNAENTIFYHNDSDGLFKKGSGSEAVTISSGQNDNYVFAKDAIYFRDHGKDGKAFYGISKGAYDAVKEMPASIVRATDGEIHGGASLNVSSSWMVYYNRVGFYKKLKTIDLRYVSRDGTTESVLVSDITTTVERFDPGYKALVGEVKIIGDYAYYMLKESETEYSLHRVKNDGTDKKKLASITI